MSSKEQPLVSIIITNYNYARYLKEAIDSALNQTYAHTEVIIVDDGSTDNSRQVIETYKNQIIPLYKINGGQPSAFNAAFAVSQGEIVCLLDSDDVFLPQKVENVVKAFNTYPKAVVVYHKVQNIDHAAKHFGNPWPPYKVIVGDISSKVNRTGGWWPFPPSTALAFRRKPFLCQVMNAPEESPEDKFAGVDSYLADLAPFFGEVVGLDQVLSYYRIHGSNLSGNSTNAPPQVRQTKLIQDHEHREKRLNNGLKRLGINTEVSLKNHLPYQLFKYKRGDKDTSLISLSLLALQNPWEYRILSKLKTVALLWLQRRNFQKD